MESRTTPFDCSESIPAIDVLNSLPALRLHFAAILNLQSDSARRFEWYDKLLLQPNEGSSEVASAFSVVRSRTRLC